MMIIGNICRLLAEFQSLSTRPRFLRDDEMRGKVAILEGLAELYSAFSQRHRYSLEGQFIATDYIINIEPILYNQYYTIIITQSVGFY